MTGDKSQNDERWWMFPAHSSFQLLKSSSSALAPDA
jgi:hypothetical protein